MSSKSIALLFGATFFIIWNLYSCAQQGSISGGPKDVTPPKFLSSSPDTLSLNVTTKLDEIIIDFDELVLLKDYSKQIVISPPLPKNPSFAPLGIPKKYVRLGFEEPLDSATTYSVQFGNAIQDFNENNPLKGYKFVFSTGDYLDSLQVKGTVTDYENSKLPQNILVALYKVDSAYSDTLVEKAKPFYISKLDSVNQFNLDYLKPGKYQLLAFDDASSNLKLEKEKERIAFANEVVTLNENKEINLRLFQNKFDYRAKSAEQVSYGQFKVITKGEPKDLEIKIIDEDIKSLRFYRKAWSDSTALWFNPKIDSLGGEKSKRLFFTVKNGEQIDTLKTVYKKEKVSKLEIGLSTTAITPFDTVELKSNHPIVRFNLDSIRVKRDSTFLEFDYRKKSDFRHQLIFQKNWAKNYNISVLPGAFIDLFEQSNDSLSFGVRTPLEKQKGNLQVTLQNMPKHKFWLKLYNAQDKLVSERYTLQAANQWKGLTPGKYKLKLYTDENGNGLWDTGDFFSRKQPEAVFLYPKEFEIKANWDLEETWILK